LRKIPKSHAGGGVKIEDILAEELRREMFVTPSLKFRYVDDWDTVLQSVYELPIEYNGYTKKVGEMNLLREMINNLAKGDFDDVKRSESRRKQLRAFQKTSTMYYNLVFRKKNVKTGYGALIFFPELRSDDPERSRGIVLGARHSIKGRKKELVFERAKFDDFLLEVRPYIEILGELYRQVRQP